MECLSSRREREAPGGRARENRKFIQAPSPEICSETISGGEEVLAGKWGGLFLGYLLGKIFGGVIAIISIRPGGWMQQSAVPRCAILSVGSTGGAGSETARLRYAARQRGCCVAARGGRAAKRAHAADRRAHQSAADDPEGHARLTAFAQGLLEAGWTNDEPALVSAVDGAGSAMLFSVAAAI